MEITFIPHTSCTGCGACLNACPVGCIEMKLDEEKFEYPVIDESRCIHCNKCEKACPVKNRKRNDNKHPLSYAVVVRDENIRRQSSSGGLFSALAHFVLEQEGIVYGVAMSENCREIRHIAVEKEDELEKLRGSKYVQSSTEKCYQEIRTHLENGRIVLFSGTPCQVEGLKCFLQKEYQNLYTADLICHGVPSQYVWNKYLDYQEGLEGSTVRRTYFRHKKSGWNTFSILLKYINNMEYVELLTKDPYLQAFLNNVDLRSCCHSCDFKTVSRNSDFTMADLWGIDYICPEWNDDKGVSLLLIHSKKGERIIPYMESYCKIKEIDTDLAISHNIMAIKSMKEHPKRNQFIHNIDKLPFDQLVQKYGYTHLTLRAKVGKMLRKYGLRK